jgi:hypothetical protein
MEFRLLICLYLLLFLFIYLCVFTLRFVLENTEEIGKKVEKIMNIIISVRKHSALISGRSSARRTTIEVNNGQKSGTKAS